MEESADETAKIAEEASKENESSTSGPMSFGKEENRRENTTSAENQSSLGDELEKNLNNENLAEEKESKSDGPGENIMKGGSLPELRAEELDQSNLSQSVTLLVVDQESTRTDYDQRNKYRPESTVDPNAGGKEKFDDGKVFPGNIEKKSSPTQLNIGKVGQPILSIDTEEAEIKENEEINIIKPSEDTSNIHAEDMSKKIIRTESQNGESSKNIQGESSEPLLKDEKVDLCVEKSISPTSNDRNSICATSKQQGFEKKDITQGENSSDGPRMDGQIEYNSNMNNIKKQPENDILSKNNQTSISQPTLQHKKEDPILKKSAVQAIHDGKSMNFNDIPPCIGKEDMPLDKETSDVDGKERSKTITIKKESQNNELSGKIQRGNSEPILKHGKLDSAVTKKESHNEFTKSIMRGNSEPILKHEKADPTSKKSIMQLASGKKGVRFASNNNKQSNNRQNAAPQNKNSKITSKMQSSKITHGQESSFQPKVHLTPQAIKLSSQKLRDSQSQPVRSKISSPPRTMKKIVDQSQEMKFLEDVSDVLVIGGGVVGAAVLRAATLSGYKAIMVESKPDLLTGASSGNSGIICTGVDAAPGSLERALIRDSISQIRLFLKRHRVPHRDCGSLVCQWDWDQVGRDNSYTSPLSRVLAQSVDAGDTHASRLTPGELREVEPNVSPFCKGAVHIPGEIVVDPWLYSIALIAHARENGAKVFTNFEVETEKAHFDKRRRIWTVKRRVDENDSNQNNLPLSIRAKSVVNATGIMADLVQSGATPCVYPPHWKSMPRRGQYKIFRADKATFVTHPIQPVPTQRTKGVFIYSTLYNQIVVGPTAEEQKSRTDRTPNRLCSDYLTSTALRVLPKLNPDHQYIGQYVGIRPATNFRDYQISMTAESRWIATAGIRSTGLTASLGIGRHVVDLLRSVLPFPKPIGSIRCTPLPDLRQMVDQFNKSEEGHVLIHGFLYKVTHPLTRFGFQARTGIAKMGERRFSNERRTNERRMSSERRFSNN